MNLFSIHNLNAQIPSAVIWLVEILAIAFLVGYLGMLIYKKLKNRKEKKSELDFEMQGTAYVNKEKQNEVKPLDLRKVKEIKKELSDTARNSISLEFKECGEYVKGATRFGGLPDVPKDFIWPHFECSTFDDEEIKSRPLSFLAQFNLAELSRFDAESLLPEHGLLSFFHKHDAQNYGTKAEDMPSLKVFYFEDVSALELAKAPEDLSADCIFKQAKITAKIKKTYMDFEEYCNLNGIGYEILDEYFAALESFGGGSSSHLLGWAEWLQASETAGFELISKGYSFDTEEERKKIPIELSEKANRTAAFDWLLLLELDSIELEEYGLMYGDVGNLYVFIKREDLLKKNFDKAYFTWQCT